VRLSWCSQYGLAGGAHAESFVVIVIVVVVVVVVIARYLRPGSKLLRRQ